MCVFIHLVWLIAGDSEQSPLWSFSQNQSQIQYSFCPLCSCSVTSLCGSFSVCSLLSPRWYRAVVFFFPDTCDSPARSKLGIPFGDLSSWRHDLKFNKWMYTYVQRERKHHFLGDFTYTRIKSGFLGVLWNRKRVHSFKHQAAPLTRRFNWSLRGFGKTIFALNFLLRKSAIFFLSLLHFQASFGMSVKFI